MSLGIRGFNPIWAEFDLQGNIFDDTFYMYVLENIFPNIPAKVYHDPNLMTPWTNPIQFLANGTLPIDIYFEEGTVYRLEFRKNNGVNPPSQSDALIYEVNNYVNGQAINPPGTDSFPTANQITNPQFAIINLTTPFTLNATNPAPIEIGPGWFLDVSGTGTVTINKVPLNSASPNPSNAPYALELILAGWAAGSVFLRQRFQQNGMLWALKFVSTTITARVIGPFQSISATLDYSNGTSPTKILDVPTVNAEFTEYSGVALLPASANTDIPPAAYMDYRLALPSNTDILVTSIQLIVQDNESQPAFEQDSIQRQIDHTYHTAYPIVPVGAIIDFAGPVLPEHYLLCNGASLLISEYRLLFGAIGTTWGGDGVTNFLLPNLTDYVTAGAGGALGALGVRTGVLSHNILLNEIPNHTHSLGNQLGNTPPNNSIATGAGALLINGSSGGIEGYGSQEQLSLVQPTALVQKIIRYN